MIRQCKRVYTEKTPYELDPMTLQKLSQLFHEARLAYRRYAKRAYDGEGKFWQESAEAD